MAIVAVPETTIDLNNGPVLWENDVWRSWQAFVVYPKTVAQSMELATYDFFGSSIPASNSRHHFRAFGLCDDIGH